ncbi:MAG TPA: hypothetical protein PL173_13055 [Saprospiraceae bacterium]|nr:hypothetical protein [Saprospiraceae bacterium]HNI55790.1 hypothetical protein [Chitinophagales bacterium]
MKHFGNSLSYEEIIEDMKIVDKEVIYIGTQVQTKNFGNYTGGKFVSTNTKQITSVYKIVFRSGKYHLISDDDSGYFDTLEQAKNRARKVFGTGIKWKLKQ